MKDDLKDAQILIVEDEDYQVNLIAGILKSHGYKNISIARSGTEALEIIERENIDLILLDLLLPDIPGLEICKQLNKSHKNIPVIVQSAIDLDQDKQLAFELGVNDFISKPIHKIDLLARTENQLRQYQLIQNLQHAKSKAEAEIEDALQVMTSILPTDEFIATICTKYNVSIASIYRPSSKLGGDFYDIVEHDDGKLGLYLWDFSGHGILAAINTFRLYSIIKHDQNNIIIQSASSFLSSVNDILFKMLERQYFATMFYGVLDIKARMLEFSCASCPPPVLISLKQKKYLLLDSTEFPLGVINEHKYKSRIIDLQDWDALMFYSDALIETANEEGTFLKAEDIAQGIVDNLHNKASAIELKEDIMNRFGKIRFANLKDDLTLTVLVFTKRHV